MQSTNAQVLVIGAGFAGLGAATCLQEKGFKVEVLEARDRVGGRICDDTSFGFPLGRGANWIHGLDGNPMVELAQRFGVSFSPVDVGRFYTFDRHGQRIPPEVLDAFEEDFENSLIYAKDFAQQSPQDLSLADALAPFFKPKALSPVQQDLFKRKLGFFQGYVGADYQRLSARNWDHELSLPGGHAILSDTYVPIIQGLAASCSVRLNTVVTAIQVRDNGVDVLTDQGCYQAEAVLVTVPLSLLQQKVIHFDPPLPVVKQKAIERLGMGLFNIAALKFPRLFWEEDSRALFFSEFDAESISTFMNYYQVNRQPILLGYSGGDKALKIEQASDQQILAKVMDNLRRHYGRNIPEPEAYFFTRWSQDPFSRGSYSYLPVGASEGDREELAQPASARLFFAGEASNRDFPATTHGAYWSGLREAQRIESGFLLKVNEPR